MAKSLGVPDAALNSLEGRSIVITGASDGIGRAAVSRYASAGAQVLMIGRNEAKTAAAARAIMSETNTRHIRWLVADLSRRDAVAELASRISELTPTIDVLVNNAGALFLERDVTSDGIERTLALNHLGYMGLTLRLLTPLAAAARTHAPARILCVSSRAHRDAKLDVADLQSERSYAGWRAYGNSKLANILFTKSLARRLDPAQIVVHALHPGVVSTRFAVNNGRRGRLLRRIMDVVSIGPDDGADTMVWLSGATDATASTGDYWVKRRRVEPSKDALDPHLAERVWSASSTLLALDADALVAACPSARTDGPVLEADHGAA